MSGCDTYAMGYGLDKDHSMDMARSALNSVKKLALRERDLRQRCEKLEAVLADNQKQVG